MTAAKRLAIVGVACVMWSATAHTQWLNYPSAGIRRLPDGRPNVTAPVPRAADGKPDLSGVWEVVGDRVMETDGRVRSKYVYNIAVDLPGGAPFLPWAKAVYDQRQRALPFKILQMPGVTVILYEEFNNWRQIFTDGRPLPTDPQPAWLGYSVGSWDGDTFVVETAGFNDMSWLDAGGTPHTDALRTTERLRRIDTGRMEVTFTFDDPKTFTAPWSATVRFNLLPDTELLEHHCDNEKWAGQTRR